MHTDLDTYTHTHECAYTCAQTHTHEYTRTYTDTHAHTNTYTHACTHTRTHVLNILNWTTCVYINTRTELNARNFRWLIHICELFLAYTRTRIQTNQYYTNWTGRQKLWMTHSYVWILHDSIARFNHMCEWSICRWLIHMCEWSICRWLIHMRKLSMTHSYVWIIHDSFTWPIHTCKWSICVNCGETQWTQRTHTYGWMTNSYIWMSHELIHMNESRTHTYEWVTNSYIWMSYVYCGETPWT